VVMFRTLILFTIVIIAMRIMGKRQIGQLQPYELAVLIMISALAAIPMEDISIPLFNSIIPFTRVFRLVELKNKESLLLEITAARRLLLRLKETETPSLRNIF